MSELAEGIEGSRDRGIKGPEADVLVIMYVHSRPGVLAKIASMFYRRGLNICTLTVGAAHEPELAKMVVRVAGARREIERLVPSIGNLIDVLSVELADVAAVRAQELCLVRVAAAGREARDAVLAAVAPFQPALIDAGTDSVVLEVAATPSALDLFLDTVARFGVLDVSRTGVTIFPALQAPSLTAARLSSAMTRRPT